MEIAKLIEEKFLVTWSPEQIANTAVLGPKRKLRKSEKHVKFSMGTAISERPKEVKTRETFGHCKLDTIMYPIVIKARDFLLLLLIIRVVFIDLL